MDQAARAAFKAFEHKGWEQLADSYYEVSHASTAKAAEDLLDAVGLGKPPDDAYFAARAAARSRDGLA